METKEYYLGLDMGTNSVGWAVTDSKYQLIRVKGKDFWGVREFDEAQSAVDRRTKRVSRRRRQREQARIGLLKIYFAKEIEKNDPYFYQRLDNSKYFEEDKEECVRGKNGIFADDKFTDKEYFKLYPTIFHLRKALIENEQGSFDVRLVYLALLNMFKHRGHFLASGLSDDGGEVSMNDAYLGFVECADELLEVSFPANLEYAKGIEDTLSDRALSRSAKKEKLIELFCLNQKQTDEASKEKQKKQIAMVKCICGLSTGLKDIFDDVETENKIEIHFANAQWDEKCLEIQTALGEERYQLIECLKQIYDIGSLANILKGQKYLSFARVEEYKKHQKDLKLLKQLYKKHKTLEEYDRMFRSDEKGSYSAYVNSFNCDKTSKKMKLKGKPVRRNMDDRSREALYKKIKEAFKDINDDDVRKIFDDIERESFLPKQLTAGNGIIPNQVHRREMAVILKNAEGYLPFLKEKDESGLTVSERILRLFSFQIPYYIGPLSENSAKYGGNGWVIRTQPGQVLPWNLEEKVDTKKTAQRFIENLVKNCTYLSDEKVLPKSSLLYEKYCVLNEINNIKVNGERISVELKQRIYKDLFCNKNRVTRKMVENFLYAQGALQEAAQLSGIDQNINNSLSSYRKFYTIFGDDLKRDDIQKMVERIIYLCTVYGDSKSMLKECLKDEFKDQLTNEQVKKILKFRFRDWGSLSKEMLELQGCDTSIGEMMSLIRAMWETDLNFMELIHSDKFTFAKSLEDKQTVALKMLSDFEAEDLNEYYFSAPVKRMIWQTILIIREVEKIMGCAPKRIFIEMTRSDDEKGDKGRKDSRAKALMDLYKNIKDESRDWKGEIEKAEADGRLRSKKLYLYYTQQGKCMYTGEPIDLHELLYGNKYDIDHIYPRHFVKDDNLSNNMVLVNKASNAYKSDNYPLPEMSEAVHLLWRELLNNHFITEEKYRRLTGRNPFTEEQKAGFIARQLVETGQGTKGIADLLKQLMSDETTIVYSKGRNVSDFRNEFKLLKSRSINDFHHAKDAYLNIVVGNVYFVKFTQNPLNYMRKLDREKKTLQYHLGKMFQNEVRRGDEVAWIPSPKDGEEKGTIVTVKKMMGKNTPLLTRMSFESHGGIANETLYSARVAKEDNYIPLKGNDPRMQDVTKYGGVKNVTGTYFFLVEHEDKKGKKIRTLEQMPLYLVGKIGRDEDSLWEYCIQKLKLKNPSIRMKRIKTQSLISINGYKYHLSGRSEDRILLRNAVSLCLSIEWNNYAHEIDKYIETGNLSETITEEKNIQLYEIMVNKHLSEIFAKRQNPVGDSLRQGLEKMKRLSIQDQTKLLGEVFKLTSIGATSADLRLIGGTAGCGSMRFSKKVTNANQFVLINQSVTGIYERSIDLLAV